MPALRRVIPVLCLALLLTPRADAREDCGCDDLATIEREIVEQEYMRDLFKQWSIYMPANFLSTADMIDRAERQFYHTFYGVPMEKPHASNTAAGAAAATLYTDASCPIVRYVYDKKGNPVYRKTEESRKNKLDPPKYKRLMVRTTEATFPSEQCNALVHYMFVHEKHHQHTCENTTAKGHKEFWENLKEFALEDLAAYEDGLKVLYEERQKLKARCEVKPQRDGRWHGIIEYAYAYNEYTIKEVKEGEDKVYLKGHGTQESRNRKSIRARGVIDAPGEGGNIKVPYDSTHQEGFSTQGTFTMPSECGWYRRKVWHLDHGVETRKDSSSAGIVDGVLQTDGHTLTVSFRVPNNPEGAFTHHEWDKPSGYCQDQNNIQHDKTYGRTENHPGFSVSMKVEIDPDHPNDINVMRITPDSGGKGSTFYSLRLHREPAE